MANHEEKAKGNEVPGEQNVVVGLEKTSRRYEPTRGRRGES
jgi:hypothetical protein